MEQEQFTVTLCDSIDDKYRFGFNGMEKDNELKGVGNSLDFGARMYDSRVGRWLSLDPLAAKYPSMSPYNFVANSPLMFIDPDGKEIYDSKLKGTRYETVVSNVRSLDVMKSVLSNFEGKEYNITFDYGTKFTRGPNKGLEMPNSFKGTTEFGKGENFKQKRDISLKNSTILFNKNALAYSRNYPEAGYTYNYKATNIGIASTTIHEILHAMIFKDVANEIGNLDNNMEHGTLAQKYRGAMVEALTEYNAKFEESKYSEDDIEILSWGGLETTEEFKTFLKDKKMTKNTFDNKLEKLYSGEPDIKPNSNENKKK